MRWHCVLTSEVGRAWVTVGGRSRCCDGGKAAAVHEHLLSTGCVPSLCLEYFKSLV